MREQARLDSRSLSRGLPWIGGALFWAAALTPSGSAQMKFAEIDEEHIPSDGSSPVALALVDVDGDGDLDLILAASVRQNRLYLNDGTGTFTDATATHLPLGSDSTADLALGDLDGDGDPDLVLGNIGGPNRFFLNDGTGTFTPTFLLPIDSDNTSAVVMGDVDGDGDLDVIFGNTGLSSFGNPGLSSAGQQNRLYLNDLDVTGKFLDVTSSRLPLNTDRTSTLALGDVDGDGDLDLLIGNSSTFIPVSPFFLGGEDFLYLNDGAGSFTDATPADANYYDIALNDVDRDGDLDLVKQNGLFLNDGTGVFTDVTDDQMWPVRGPGPFALGDVDGDGDSDLVFKNGQTYLYRNNGRGTFIDSTAGRMPTDEGQDHIKDLALGDVDGDGDPDLVLGNIRGPNRLYLNLHRQLDTPMPPVLSQVFTLDFYANAGAGFGTSSHTAYPGLSLGLAPFPLSIPTLGDFHLDANGFISLPPVTIPAFTGRGTLELRVPADNSLVGQTVYVQALIVNNSHPYRDSHFTSYTADVIMK